MYWFMNNHCIRNKKQILESQTVVLRSSTSPETLKIHQKLLESRCKAPAIALKHGFPEDRSRQYTFTETSHDTVAQFIEWAYRAYYTDVITTSSEVNHKSKFEMPDTPSQDDSLVENNGLQAHTSLCHVRIYIFGEMYLVPGLKELALEMFTTALNIMGKPENIDEQLAVIDCLALAFSEVPLHDKLPERLAQHAAWCMDNLRLQASMIF